MCTGPPQRLGAERIGLGSPALLPEEPLLAVLLRDDRLDAALAQVGPLEERNTADRCFQRVKTWRDVATCHNQSAESFEAGLHLRGSIMWLKQPTSTT